jgi:hypothetical protein
MAKTNCDDLTWLCRELDESELAELYAETDGGVIRATVRAECERRDRAARQRRDRAALVEEWFLKAHAQYLAASKECNGRLLSRKGRETAHVTEWSLWSGSEKRVELYASEELREYWGTYPRVTVTEYLEQVRRERKAEREACMYSHCTACGWDFGHLVPTELCGSRRMCAERVERGDPEYGRPARRRQDRSTV